MTPAWHSAYGTGKAFRVKRINFYPTFYLFSLFRSLLLRSSGVVETGGERNTADQGVFRGWVSLIFILPRTHAILHSHWRITLFTLHHISASANLLFLLSRTHTTNIARHTPHQFLHLHSLPNNIIFDSISFSLFPFSSFSCILFSQSSVVCAMRAGDCILHRTRPDDLSVYPFRLLLSHSSSFIFSVSLPRYP